MHQQEFGQTYTDENLQLASANDTNLNKTEDVMLEIDGAENKRKAKKVICYVEV